MKRFHAEMLKLLGGSRFTLIDIGASGGMHRRWARLGDMLTVVGFEPDEKEYVKLQQRDDRVWFKTALAGQQGKRVLHVTKAQTNTSFLLPNRSLLDQLQWSPNDSVMGHDIIADVEVECDAIDNILESRKIRPDYVKIDTQGSELEILSGGQRLVEDTIMAEIEVEFAPVYEDQPLFADVDAFMRARGFILQDLGNFLYVKPRGLAGVGGAKGRMIAADALYIKDFTAAYKKLYDQGENRVYAAVTGCVAYGYPELGIRLLENLRQGGCVVAHTERMIDLLHTLKLSNNAFITKLPGFNSVASMLGSIWFKCRKAEHCLWDVPLGN
jgi:FkbM family methyltransferase